MAGANRCQARVSRSEPVPGTCQAPREYPRGGGRCVRRRARRRGPGIEAGVPSSDLRRLSRTLDERRSSARLASRACRGLSKHDRHIGGISH